MSEDNFIRYVITLTTVSNSKTTTDQIKAHVHFLQKLDQSGQLEMCGPFIDWEGGMIIIKAEDKEEAIKIAESDPFVKSNVRDFEIRTWQLSCEKNNHLGVIENND